jgi:hypothetical protein
VRDRDIDDVLNRAAGASPGVDPDLLAGITRSIGGSLRPVTPLPPSWILAGVPAAVCVAVAVAGAAILGPRGIQKMDAAEIGLIFPVLGLLVWIAAAVYAGEMIPGSRRIVGPGMLAATGSVALIAVFALLFHDYGTGRFVPQGLTCLTAGLLHAIPAAVGGWLILRRGFAVNAPAAGLAGGVLAGLAGVSMLELHCANFEAPHVMLWHTAVLPLSGAAGALLGWVLRRRLTHH